MEHMWQDWATGPVGGAMDTTVTTGRIQPRMIVRGSPDMVVNLPASLPNRQQYIERRALIPPTSEMLPCEKWHTAFVDDGIMEGELQNSYLDDNGSLIVDGRTNRCPVVPRVVLTASSEGDAKLRTEDITHRTDVRSVRTKSDATTEFAMVNDAGDTTVAPVRKTSRRKYDELIDPELPENDKKKQRRILANRASARRSRERKKEMLQKLMEREKDLIRERDAAVQERNEQIRMNLIHRERIELLQRQLATYERNRHSNAYLLHSTEGFGEVDSRKTRATEPMTSAEFFSVSTGSATATEGMDPGFAGEWYRCCSRI